MTLFQKVMGSLQLKPTARVISVYLKISEITQVVLKKHIFNSENSSLILKDTRNIDTITHKHAVTG